MESVITDMISSKVDKKMAAKKAIANSSELKTQHELSLLEP